MADFTPTLWLLNWTETPLVSVMARHLSRNHSTSAGITANRKSRAVFEQPLQDVHSVIDLSHLVWAKRIEVSNEILASDTQ